MCRPSNAISTEIRSPGIEIVIGDLVKSSIDELASVFAQYDTVIGCAGYAAGIDTPMNLAKAALQSGIPRYFPWQFGVDFDVIGRGGPQDIFDAQWTCVNCCVPGPMVLTGDSNQDMERLRALEEANSDAALVHFLMGEIYARKEQHEESASELRIRWLQYVRFRHRFHVGRHQQLNRA